GGRVAGETQGVVQVLFRRQFVLEGARVAEVGRLSPGDAAFAIPRDLAGGGRREAGEGAQQGRLAAAVGGGDGDQRGGVYAEGQVGEQRAAPAHDGQAAHLQQAHCTTRSITTATSRAPGLTGLLLPSRSPALDMALPDFDTRASMRTEGVSE